DTLLEIMEKTPEFKFFHTDSQVSIIYDYLELRPESLKRIKNLVNRGRLLIGPWYTLPAEYLVSGEALARNLLMGHSLCKKIGHPMKVGYNVFSWGQISQLPQLYKQFGIDTILFYRGIDNEILTRNEFLWKSPDGTQILGIAFGPQHRINFWAYVYRPYVMSGNKLGVVPNTNSFIAALGDRISNWGSYETINEISMNDYDSALKGLNKLIEVSAPKHSTKHLLFFQGYDFEFPNSSIINLIQKLNKNINKGKIVISSLPHYVSEIKKQIFKKNNNATKKMQVFCQEMLSIEKYNPEYGQLYPGVFSARMPIKIRNFYSEMRLERWAEPMASLSFIIGKRFPDMALKKAWMFYLQNHQHDGIGGCYIDDVELSMLNRYSDIDHISEKITRDSLFYILSEIDSSSLKGDIILTVFNPSLYTQSAIVETYVDIPFNKVYPDGGLFYRNPKHILVKEPNGQNIPVQILGYTDERACTKRKFCDHGYFHSVRFRILFEARDIPSMGYKCFEVAVADGELRPSPSAFLSSSKMEIENNYLEVKINFDGSIDIRDKINGNTYQGLNYFEDTGEQGGPLYHIPPKNNKTFCTIGVPAEISLIENGVLRATYMIRHKWQLPKSLSTQIRIHHPNIKQWIDFGELSRSEEMSTVDIISYISLDAISPFIRIKTEIINSCKDHRLRVMFPSDISTDFSIADIPFDIVKRNIAVPDSSGWLEPALRYYPSSSFVSLHAKARGLSVIHFGLSEYEVMNDTRKTIALTLLRCYSSGGGAAETYFEKPLAQCQGKHTFEYFILPHSQNHIIENIASISSIIRTPLRVAISSPHKGKNPLSYSFLSISDKRLILSCLKKAEDKNAIILRIFNPYSVNIKALVELNFDFISVQKITMEEKVVRKLPSLKNKINIKVRSGEIYSIMVNL
ncbi:MAG TPA: glycoside hydrolase family 38 C-terminal domain-containing protein, partial [Victivallales bacterium]|nr:glycoside hydrolase family 38 C-terminal domain-containing protein [Victivallales bacterium]